jgi:hypothetical protein
MRNIRAAGAALVLVLAAPLGAQEPPARIQFGGFGTVGLAATDSHRVAYPRDTTAYTGATDHPFPQQDSRLGLQGHLRLADTLGATLQVVSKYRYNATFMPDISKAELVWNPALGTTVHAGRMSFESQIDQNVGYDYLWVRPPAEIYSAIAVGAMDGVDVNQALPLWGKAVLILKAYAGTSAGRIAIWRVGDMDFNGGREFGMVAGVLDGPWRIGLSAGQIWIPSEFPGGIARIPAVLDGYAGFLGDPRLAQSGGQFSIRNARERGWGVIATYSKDPLLAEGQFTRTYTDKWLLRPVTSGCLYVGYKVGAVRPYAMYARTLARRLDLPYLGAIPALPDPVSQGVAPGIADLLRGLNRDQYTWSLGARWDFNPRAALKAQVDWTRNPRASAPLSQLQAGADGNLKVFTVLVDFKFGREAARGFTD